MAFSVRGYIGFVVLLMSNLAGFGTMVWILSPR